MKRGFDRFASRVEEQVAQPWFFACCVTVVVLWGPSYFMMPDLDTWQLVINTFTTIVTFLLVALIQNTQDRFEDRMRWEQKAQRYALETLMRHLALRAGPDYETERLLSAILEMRNIAEGRGNDSG